MRSANPLNIDLRKRFRNKRPFRSFHRQTVDDFEKSVALLMTYLRHVTEMADVEEVQFHRMLTRIFGVLGAVADKCDSVLLILKDMGLALILSK